VRSGSSMMRLRMFIGLTSALHGLGALRFDYDVGIAWLVRAQDQGWQFAAALLVGGLLMAYAAAREWGGERRRLSRSLSSFVVAVTLLAPAYVFFCLWAWLGEASVQRRRVIGEGTT
jgi:hypothetical protein